MTNPDTRIFFIPWTAPDGQVQMFPDDVLAISESIETDAGWLHVVVSPSRSEKKRVRSYPAHAVASVRYRSDE